MTEATAVEPRGRITPDCLGIWSDEHAEAIEPIVEFVKSQGATPGFSSPTPVGRPRTNPGRGRRPDSCGPRAGLGDGFRDRRAVPGPRPELGRGRRRTGVDPPMDGEGIDDVIDAFTAAAERARVTLASRSRRSTRPTATCSTSSSPVTNDRDDAYGGSFENRTRLLREVVEAVREVWPDDQPVFVRISATDWLPDRDSWDVDDSVRLPPLLAEAGADLIDVSGAGSTRISSFRGQGRAIRCRTPRRFGRGPTCPSPQLAGSRSQPTPTPSSETSGPTSSRLAARCSDPYPYWPLEAAHELGADVAAGAVPARSVRLTRCRRRRRARIRPVRLRPPRTLREDLFRSREPTAYGVPTLPRRTQR